MKYGFLTYDRALCSLIVDRRPPPGQVLEVACGSGYPFSQTLRETGYEVHGLDISDELIAECRRLHPDVRSLVGDAERLPYAGVSFDLTFCFHSSFYFPDLLVAVDEMLRVTKPPGLVLFDIQNRYNPEIAKAHARRQAEVQGFRRILRYGRNIAKVILRRGFPDWSNLVYEMPADPIVLTEHLLTVGVREVSMLARMSHDRLEVVGLNGRHEPFSRLVFVVLV